MTKAEESNSKGGMEGIVAATTRLSDVQGLTGKLIYCGYDINDLAGKVNYEEVVYLLHQGQLPNRSQLESLRQELTRQRELPSGAIDLLRSLPADTQPMNAIRTVVSALGCFDPEANDVSFEAQRRKATRLIAQIPIVTAYFHLSRQGKPLPSPDPGLGEAENFLYLINGRKPNEEEVETLDLCYVLHADHGMNASTFSSRVTIATLSDMHSAICSAIGTLKGPLHGGANEGVIRMLQDIGSLEAVEAAIDEKLERKEKIMGFGHRVYKVLDPRAPLLMRVSQRLGDKVGDSRWIRMSQRIAELMKKKKKLNANVDFYSASVYYSLGIPIDLFTPLFAIARTSGWTAHVLEQLADNRLIRPESEYEGLTDLQVKPIDER